MRLNFTKSLCCVLLFCGALVPAAAVEKTVRVIYLVSADRETNAEYAKAAEMAIRDIQTWYARQLNGVTFRLHEPVIEILKSDKNASWFYSNPRKSDKDNWGYENTFDEVKRLAGTRHFDPDNVWVIYSDGPGNKGRGGSGVCIMPEDDLLGLIGQHPEQKEINRWIAGLGHELGHAFGLPHPKDTKKDADAIMWSGIYGKYPDKTYLTAEDKEMLRKNPFFYDKSGTPVTGQSTEMAQYVYGNGRFKRLRNEKTKVISWEESTASGALFRFTEVSSRGNIFELKAVDRQIQIRIPAAGGKGQISTDAGKSWRFFQDLQSRQP